MTGFFSRLNKFPLWISPTFSWSLHPLMDFVVGLCLCYWKQCHNKHGYTGASWCICFISFVYIPSTERAELPGSLMNFRVLEFPCYFVLISTKPADSKSSLSLTLNSDALPRDGKYHWTKVLTMRQRDPLWSLKWERKCCSINMSSSTGTISLTSCWPDHIGALSVIGRAPAPLDLLIPAAMTRRFMADECGGGVSEDIPHGSAPGKQQSGKRGCISKLLALPLSHAPN